MINARSVDFSGAPGQVCYSFRTAIHYFDVRGVRHIANLSNPQIPAALAPAVAGIVSLNDFKPHPMVVCGDPLAFDCASGARALCHFPRRR
jgi:hypothetical protein